jgi:capsular polysaccharide biosynthesis protein
MPEQSFNQNLEDEFSLKDIIDFLVESWKAILVTGVLGVLVAGTYIVVTPNKYEATAQIEMAKINNNNNNNSSSLLGSNIEDPNLLIARMKSPSNYDQASIVACGFEGEKQAAERLAKMIKVGLSKGTQMVELKATGLSQEQAMQCAQSVFNNIKQSQKMIAEPIIEESKAKLARYAARLQEAQTFISKADKSGSSMSAAYLSTRDEMKHITDEITLLNDLISSASNRQTKLVSPIYVSQKKVAPKEIVSLTAGLMGGIFFGLLLMIGLRSYRSYKTSSPQ